MTDIVKRLRGWERIYAVDAHEDGALYNAAADEIERLRKSLEGIVKIANSPSTANLILDSIIYEARAALEGK